MAKELKFPSVNTLIISGRLTRDLELKYTPNGHAVASLSMAFSRSYQVNGEWKEESSFIDVVVWNKLAERCAQQLHKGSPILVEGYLQTRSYTTKDNQNRKITEIVSQRVSFLEKSEVTQTNTESTYTGIENTQPSVTEDDVPF